MVIYGLRLFLISDRQVRAVVDDMKVGGSRLAGESFDCVLEAFYQFRIKAYALIRMGTTG
jgi:hypothetical protein